VEGVGPQIYITLHCFTDLVRALYVVAECLAVAGLVGLHAVQLLA
jgi:hypothetical protein